MEEGLRTIQVWREGYVVMEGRDGAHFFGAVEATSFREACDILLKNDPSYSSKRLTWYGCQLFDNGNDAVKAFG